MAAENVKWRVNRGVRASNLPPNARLIMFVLSDMANAETGIIPMKQTPSLADLARETGLGESTVKEYLATLEQLGWVERRRPNASERARHSSTYYRVMIGEPGKERAPLKRKPRARSKPSGEVSKGQEMAIADGQDVTLESAPEGAPEGQEQAIGDSQEMALDSHPESESEGQELASRGPGANDPRASSWPSYIKDDDLNDLTIITSADAAEAPPKADGRKGKPKTPAAPPRDDVMRVCNHLADRIHANGSKRPDFGKTWLDAARLMLDRDGPTGTGIPEADIHAGIDWCQDSDFWRGNVMSLPKFREKYDQMRLQAQRAAPGKRPSAMQQRIDEGLERHNRMRLLDEAEGRGEAVPPGLFSALPPGTLGGLT